MPDFENLRKQAKLVLRWHRDRYYPVAAQISSTLPRYRDMTDAEVLSCHFKLSDAQELVARQNGFETWEALKRGLSTMPDKADRGASKPRIVAAEPQLLVASIDAACDFFCRKLGFSTVFSYGDPAFYAQVARDGARINLRHIDRSVIDAEIRDRDELLAASLTVADADALKELYLEFQVAGVGFFQTLRKQPWGARTFIVRDLDGNLLLFAGPDD